MAEKFTLAVYDENRLQKELLHHQLERMRYEILYSTTDRKQLLEFFNQRPADILLMNGITNLSDFRHLIETLRKNKGKLKVIFYCLDIFDKDICNARINGVELYHAGEGWDGLLNAIENVMAKHTEVKKENKVSSKISAAYPFPKISENQKYIEILRYLKEGKSNRQIA